MTLLVAPIIIMFPAIVLPTASEGILGEKNKTHYYYTSY